MTSAPLTYFRGYKDHRMKRKQVHKLDTIIAITLAAIISGAESWYDIEDFGIKKQRWLGQFLDLSGGIPSHDTFNRFFAKADSAALEQCFSEWVSSIASTLNDRVISIDGKCLRGSRVDSEGSFIHMVSAWCNESNLVLGQQKVYEKSNEITAIPKLLDALFIDGAIITIDAMGTQKEIAKKIIAGKGDYVLAVKGNQEFLEDDIKDAFKEVKADDEYEAKVELSHGRIETRTTKVIHDLDWVCSRKEWQQLYCIIMVLSKRIDKKSGKQEDAVRYYISSKNASAEQFNSYIRSHWGIENKLHWTLDVAFREDQSKKREGNAAQNFSLMTKVALNLIKNHNPGEKDKGGTRISARRKRNMAAWDNDYLLEMIAGAKI
ncbi:Predicted transposase YbfD/YdcC associated with H repeats [Arachidicoccus rhizosphaerae]|jgi:predicted transposase YbfD/YdcC|uniref:Predicted transposase YbfD/YdcC associated with H repeats n=1 Tax=Arachidicoccus rhizosphaerae TaxID=551991 RepID=A0A1H3VEB0_9BACT|nr:ISAs1 family transposase [Arachidicoccus rhizosphaerae]SDZ73079.1 Predicted transposase YbfD/YdcC associated with H repeats [Arachidicoccus rhizosphaerae]SEA60613.1 Predicted transposase YbfD/YdcC associated with H repeats [Arachidicoccus rhizosphaerae]